MSCGIYLTQTLDEPGKDLWLYHSVYSWLLCTYLGNVGIVPKTRQSCPKTSQFGTTAVPFREELACYSTKVVHNS